MERELYAKYWEMNTVRTAKGVILLDMVYTINSKSYDIKGANMLVAMDN